MSLAYSCVRLARCHRAVFGPTGKSLPRTYRRRYSSSSSGPDRRLVLGCGSNVVDQLFKVQALPQPGQKGFFQSPNKVLESRLIGGVTLNHLCWAQLLGVPTGLLALQGEDVSGRFIRQQLKRIGVGTEFIRVKQAYTTAQCFVYIQRDGERSIMMAPGSTSLIDSQMVRDCFAHTIQTSAAMVTTEISQVPLSGVEAILSEARKAEVLSVLDLDVSPSVAVKEAGLGTMEEVISCMRQADVLKPARHAAEEALEVLQPDVARQHNIQAMPAVELGQRLRDACGVKMVAMTSGSQPSSLVTENLAVTIPTDTIGKVVDATGAGDAFLGGLITGLYKEEGVPSTEDKLRELGEVANRFGAACCQVLGGVPTPASRETLADVITSFQNQCSGAVQTQPLGQHASLESARKDAESVRHLLDNLKAQEVVEFCDILDNAEVLLISGIGKSGHVAERMASSLSSIGVASDFVHSTELLHGNMGKVGTGSSSVVVFLSNSGTTSECLEAARHLIERGVSVLSVTGSDSSPLAKISNGHISHGKPFHEEPAGGVPTSSIILQEVIVNCVVNEMISRLYFTAKDFKQNHPGGALGRKLRGVK